MSTTGKPLDVMKMIQTLDVAYLARGTVTNNSEVLKTKKYIRKAFEAQKANKGYSLVEILSTCPTNWGITPLASCENIEKAVKEIYPLGELCNGGAE